MMPPRLVERRGLTGALLESARADVPSREGRERARAAGLAAIGAGAGASAALLAGGAKAAGKSALLLGAKWVVVAAIPISVATVSYVALRPSEAPLPKPVASAAVAPPSGSPSASPLPDGPPLEAAAVPPVVAPAPSPSTQHKVLSLEEQITELDAARHALARGDVSLLDRYLAAYPHGAMHEQALWLKISQLQERGRTSEAKARARELLSAYPRSSYAEKARRILEH